MSKVLEGAAYGLLCSFIAVWFIGSMYILGHFIVKYW